jgi:hypothetical protein
MLNYMTRIARSPDLCCPYAKNAQQRMSITTRTFIDRE